MFEIPSVLEGIDNSVLLILSISFTLVLAVTIYYLIMLVQKLMSFGIERSTVIHPDNEGTVNVARSQLNYPERAQHRHQIDNATCPICLENAQLPVESNCGHYYCGRCITTYWQVGTWAGSISCPVCRAKVSILLKCYPASEAVNADAETRQVIEQINLYNRRYSGESISIMDQMSDLPVILRHTVSNLLSAGGIGLMFRARIVVCFVVALVYLISPFDLIPEAAFGILGIIDDLFVVCMVLLYVATLYRHFITAAA